MDSEQNPEEEATWGPPGAEAQLLDEKALAERRAKIERLAAATRPSDPPTARPAPSTGSAPTRPLLGVADPSPPKKPSIPDVEILGLLGRGGMGVVYRARQAFLDRPVAVKCLDLSPDEPADLFNARFRREAKILADLEHPNIVRCHHAGFDQAGAPYLMMELVEGPSLQQHLDRRGPLPERAAVAMIRDIARALEYALEKSRMIHRDIKPGNILLKPVANAAEGDPFPFIPKLADLGLARCQSASTGDNSTLTESGSVVGTPSMMSPEQIDNPAGIDFRSDIYSLGCVLFESLTRQAAFPQASLASLVQAKVLGKPPDPGDLSPDLRPRTRALVREMLAPKAADRPQSYAALIARCDQASAPGPTPGEKSGFLGRIFRRRD